MMREYIVKFETDTPLSEITAGTTVRAMMKTTGDCDEVIRCRDCKHHGEQYGNGYCMKDGCYGWYDTDYCSRAERKEE